MALTLVEAAKLFKGNPLLQSVIEIYARESDILRTLPFEDIPGNAYRYNREQTLPGISFRGVNEAYPESTGVINPQTEPLVIAGGDLDVDAFIVETMGEDERSVHESMKVKALAMNWTLKFIKGDSVVQPREFDGLQVRLVGAQVIDNSLVNGGAGLSLAQLDALIDAVKEPQYLIMNKTMRRIITAAARNINVGGMVSYRPDEFGRTQTVYNDLPILIADEDNTGAQILPFTEISNGVLSICTSIYCVSFGDGKLKGIQSHPMDVRDLGELQTQPAFRTRVEWFNGIGLFHTKAAARLRYIRNAAATV